jgi:hypothetical protein
VIDKGDGRRSKTQFVKDNNPPDFLELSMSSGLKQETEG